MNKEIVVVVPTEASAYEVVKALGALDDEGSIELYSSTVVEKTLDGTVNVKDTRHLRGPWGTLLGVSTGALIGLLGGPAGVAIGAAIGGAAGLGGDLAYSGFAGDFVHDVSTRLQPGAFAVCASIWEDWTMPIDVAVAPFGSVVFRQATEDMIIAQIKTEMQAIKEEEAHLEEELKKSNAETKAKFVAKRDELHAKQTAQRAKLEKRAKELQASWDAKIASIKEKAAASKAEAKLRHQHHVEKLARFEAQQKESFRQLFS